MRSIFRPLDFVVLVLLAAGVLFSAMLAWGPTEGATLVEVTSAAGVDLYPLAEANELQVEGPLGITTVVIENGGARIVDSPCPDKTCVRMGVVGRPGAWAACLPNRVMIRAVSTGNASEGVTDAVAF